MSTSSDLDINRAVRRILVKHWIDLGRLSVRATRGNVVLFGLLQRVEGHKEPLQPPTVDGLFYEINRIDGVGQVRAHFDNWTNESGRWRPHERANLLHAQEQTRDPGTKSVAE